MNNVNLVYGVKDKPGLWKTLIFAFQQVLAILAATIVVPVIINGKTGSDMSQSAALIGAGLGTIVYLCFTKFEVPCFWVLLSRLSVLCARRLAVQACICALDISV